MKKIISLLVFCISLFLIGCTISEIQSNPRYFNITSIDSSNETIKLFIHKGAGQYIEIISVENVYPINLPAMRGGYSSFLGIKFNKHIPEEYKVLKVVRKDNPKEEFSISEIEQFKQDQKGNYILSPRTDNFK